MKEETNEHYRALLTALGSIQAAAEGGSDDAGGAASPEDAAAVMVHNRALLRNKRLMLAYMCAPARAAAARSAQRGRLQALPAGCR